MSFARGTRGASVDQSSVDLDLKSNGGLGDDITTAAGRVRREASSFVGPTTLHILFFGQSNNNNVVLGGQYTLRNPTKMFNMSIGHRGAIFEAKEPLLSSDDIKSHNGFPLADLLIEAGVAENVIISNISIGGSFAADWAYGGEFAGPGYRRGALSYRIGLAQRCIKAAGLDGVRTVIDWAQGEWDSDPPPTSQALYQTALATVIAEMRETGLLRAGRVMFVPKTTRLGNLQASRDAIRAGQDFVVDGNQVRAGIDMDAIVTGRHTDGVHFTLAGAKDEIAPRKKAKIESWIAE